MQRKEGCGGNQHTSSDSELVKQTQQVPNIVAMIKSCGPPAYFITISTSTGAIVSGRVHSPVAMHFPSADVS